VDVALEVIDVIKGEKGESLGAEENRILGYGATDEVSCCAAGGCVRKRLGRKPS